MPAQAGEALYCSTESVYGFPAAKFGTVSADDRIEERGVVAGFV
jgi:hypothetical protein